MKKIFIIVAALITVFNGYSQNVGIGTSAPRARLDIVAAGDAYPQSSLMVRNSIGDTLMRLRGDGSLNFGYNGPSIGRTFNIGGTGANFFTGSGKFAGALVPTDTNFMIWSNYAVGNHLILQPDALGNVGIGTYNPQYKLDIGGRMRLRNNSGTAGIWLDGTTETIRSFIGTINDEHVGIYGNGGIGWNFSMNVDNGNTGIGTAAPTARLDVNGDIRIRGSVPKTGSVLTSTDVNGNSQWMDPVSFRVNGLSGGADANFAADTWERLYFNTIVDHNLGLHYAPVSSSFTAAERGIYTFNVQVSYGDAQRYLKMKGVRLMRNRNGSLAEIWKSLIRDYGIAGAELGNKAGLNLSTGNLQLQAGDMVYIEVYGSSIKGYYDNTETDYFISNAESWFSGHLITRF